MLTERQRLAYDLRHSTDPPLSWSKVGAEMGIDRSSARQHYALAVRKGAGKDPWVDATTARALEVRDPDKAVEMIESFTNPLARNVAAAARAEGLPPKTAAKLLRRLESKYLQTKLAVEKVKSGILVDLLSDRAKRILEAISETDISDASLIDKARAATTLLDKRQLLSGEPTQIMGTEERGHINELVQTLLLEAKRRNLEIDVTGESTRILDAEVVP